MCNTALQETDGVFVDGAYNGSVRLLYDGYLQLAYHHFFSWDRGALQVEPYIVHNFTMQFVTVQHLTRAAAPPPFSSLTSPAAAEPHRRRRVRPRAGRRPPPGAPVLHQPAHAALRRAHDIRQQGRAD